ncbi:MAG: OmpA family protein [Rhodocyclaceae bacterium]|nr:OmpA family protein [Rhodocyclaceae bacterium]MCW5614079.1 OmpA family protein [Rhodocyclaceae bacterium]
MMRDLNKTKSRAVRVHGMFSRRSMGAVAGLLLVAGCAGMPKENATLTEAREAYRSASADPRVVRSAAVELKSAEQSLREAESIMGQGGEIDMVEHQAYLARQRVNIALEKGLQAKADEDVAAAQRVRSDAVIGARTNEAEAARLRAEKASKEAEAALTRARELEGQLAELKAKPTDRGMVLTLGDVLFDTGRAKLKAGAMRTIDQLAAFMNQHPARTVLVEGHTDSVGSAAYNRKLSEQRADSVRFALMNRGISNTRIMVKGLGLEYPIASNATAEGRQTNRRVEVIISDDSGRIAERTR